MLFKHEQLLGIRDGKIDLAFRYRKKPTVKAGSLLKTAIGLVRIESMEAVDPVSLSDAEALRAGYADVQSLRAGLKKWPDGTLYRIGLCYHGADPRIELRERVSLPDAETETLLATLDRWDKASPQGAWTSEVLQTIRDHPYLRAADLALLTGKEKEWLKLHIRKLKNLGLSISHETGYTLSPLGRFILAEREKR